MSGKSKKYFVGFKNVCTFAPAFERKSVPENAEIAQLVEHDLAKVGVASSSLVFRSKAPKSERDALVVEW